MAELLLELLSEEIPARMQRRAAEDLRRLVSEKLAAAGLAASAARAFVTPRRLALVVEGLPTSQPDVTEERRGPRVGAPDQAIQGFLKAAGLADSAEAEQRDTGKGVFYFASIRRHGRPTAAVLAELLPQAVLELPWPKSMTWGETDLRWVRPLHSILCLFDGQAVPIRVGHLVAGDETRGHRFLAPASFRATSFADYRSKLEAAHVMLDPEARKAHIQAELDRLAAAAKLTLNPDEGLLEEVAGLVEWPVPMLGRIDEAFMDVPREVLTTSMRAHQKYFSFNRADGALAPVFGLVANTLAADGGRQIVAGNERVLRARLSDARFFWDLDRRTRLDSRVGALAEIVFHARLGTMAEKVRRIVSLAESLAAKVPGATATDARRAAELAKADLTSGMVGEFPELQGVMGRYYALHDGEAPSVAEAIADHYAPQGPNDRCPTAPVSVAVALADKIDTLVGFFAIGETPTGSKDPFALRRAAQGVIRLVLENGLRLSLATIFAEHHRRLSLGVDPTTELMNFIADRLKVHLRERGVRHDLVSAIFALGGEDDLVRLTAYVEALKSLLESADGANLLAAYRRAANILRIEEKKDHTRYVEEPDTSIFVLDEEKQLYAGVQTSVALAIDALREEKFSSACIALANLRGPVDAFFDKVTVNADQPNLRANRLRLLSRIRRELDRVADFSRIEG